MQRNGRVEGKRSEIRLETYEYEPWLRITVLSVSFVDEDGGELLLAHLVSRSR